MELPGRQTEEHGWGRAYVSARAAGDSGPYKCSRETQ